MEAPRRARQRRKLLHTQLRNHLLPECILNWAVAESSLISPRKLLADTHINYVTIPVTRLITFVGKYKNGCYDYYYYYRTGI